MKPSTVLKSAILAICLIHQSAFALIPTLTKPVELVLRLHERVAIEELANEVSDPSSPRYQQYFSPEEIRARVAPTDVDYNMLLTSLEQRGFSIVQESPSHLFVTVRAAHENIEAMFQTHLKINNGNLAGLSKRATMPNDLSLVASVSGLDQTRVMHRRIRQPDAKKPTRHFVTPTQVKTAYGFDAIYQSGISGKGQHIAIATYDGFHLSDIQQYYKKVALSPLPTVDQVVFNGKPVLSEDSAVETSLDGEFSGMIAPGAAVHVFASAENSDAGEVAMFTAILDDNRAKVVNYSWGSCETQVSPQHKIDMDKIYNRAIAQGVNILNASGDSGSDGCQNGTTVAGYPAVNPSIVAVGGTTVTIGSNGSLSESTWDGSGGGVSTLYPHPTYQQNFTSPYIKRSIPDVAFNADPNSGQQVWTSCNPDQSSGACAGGKPGYMTIGGTSMAAPQWAGFLALVNAGRAKLNKPTLGFLNPILYRLSASDKAKTLNDVTTGSNGSYAAGKGWDATTGFGSMKAKALFDLLVAH